MYPQAQQLTVYTTAQDSSIPTSYDGTTRVTLDRTTTRNAYLSGGNNNGNVVQVDKWSVYGLGLSERTAELENSGDNVICTHPCVGVAGMFAYNRRDAPEMVNRNTPEQKFYLIYATDTDYDRLVSFKKETPTAKFFRKHGVKVGAGVCAFMLACFILWTYTAVTAREGSDTITKLFSAGVSSGAFKKPGSL